MESDLQEDVEWENDKMRRLGKKLLQSASLLTGPGVQDQDVNPVDNSSKSSSSDGDMMHRDE